jgi:hypothetical protein
VAVQVSYPGVYIDEFAPGAPIQGVGTGTAAFIGVASAGALDTPTLITSWRAFKDTFGEHPKAGFYLWYAARGFFDNGGTKCYIVRASNGTFAELDLPDRDGNNTVKVMARDPGTPNPAITISVTQAHQLPAATTQLFQPTGNYTVTGSRTVDLTDADEAAQFKPGDLVDLSGAGSNRTVGRVSGKEVRFVDTLSQAAGGAGTIRLSDAKPDTQVVRIRSTAAQPVPDGTLVAGTVLTITQGAVTAAGVVQGVQSEQIDPANLAVVTYRVTFRRGIGAALSLDPANAASVRSEELDIGIGQGTSTTTYTALGVDPAHPRYFVRAINSVSKLVKLEAVEPPPMAALPNSIVDDVAATQLQGGQPENLATMAAQDYIDAIDTLRLIDDVNLVAVPDAMTLMSAAIPPAGPTLNVTAITTVQQALIAHCEQLADRFAVLDARAAGLPLFTVGATDGIDAQRRSVDSTRGYGALYYPWLCVAPDGPGDNIYVPPSGHVSGIIARVSQTRGVFKAPANEIVAGTIGVSKQMSNEDQGILNLLGINVVRVFNEGGRPKLWGARTTATDTNWQYVNIRRLFLFLEESIQEGILWAVFEPNNTALWQKLKLAIRAFLLQQWRDGALFGNTADEAFYVRIDDELNPFSEQALGRLHIEIGVRPSYPAEFIVVHIGIWQGGGEVTEG